MSFLAPDNTLNRLKWFSLSCGLWLASMYVLWMMPSLCFPRTVWGGGSKNVGENLGLFAPFNNRLYDYRRYPPDILGVWSLTSRNNIRVNFFGLIVTVPVAYVLTIKCWRPYAKNALGCELKMQWLVSRQERRRRKGLCPKCGYSRTGLPTDRACPECGWQAPRK